MGVNTLLKHFKNCVENNNFVVETTDDIVTGQYGIFEQFAKVIGTVNKEITFDQESNLFIAMKFLVELQKNPLVSKERLFWNGNTLTYEDIPHHKYFEHLSAAVFSRFLNSEYGEGVEWTCFPSMSSSADGGVDFFAFRSSFIKHDLFPAAFVGQSKLYNSDKPTLMLESSRSIQATTELFRSTSIQDKWLSGYNQSLISELSKALTNPLKKPIPVLFILHHNGCNESPTNSDFLPLTFSFTTICEILSRWLGDGKKIEDLVTEHAKKLANY